jgi:hypothetical protein
MWEIPLAEVQHVRRGANQATHILAKSALRFMLDLFWIQETPSHIHSTILAEQGSQI